MIADRHLIVPQGWIVKTGYVDVFKCRLACRERMAVGDVSHAFSKRLAHGSNQPFPPPNGRWEDDHFIIHDGRHQWVASIMLGLEYILVAWLAEDK